jgi:hypothetical protein
MNRVQLEANAERLAEVLWREMAGQTMKEWMLLTGEMVATPEWETFRAKVFVKVEQRMNRWLPAVEPLPGGQALAEPVPEGRRRRGSM